MAYFSGGFSVKIAPKLARFSKSFGEMFLELQWFMQAEINPSYLGVRTPFRPKIKKLAKKIEASNCFHGLKLSENTKTEDISAARRRFPYN